MIVEFTGCTASGKTAISYRVIEKLAAEGIDAVSVHPRAFNLPGLPFWGIKNESIQNIILDVRAIGPLAGSFKYNRRLLGFSCGVLKRGSDTFYEALNLFRSVCRKLGIYRLLSASKFKDRMVILDEGIVHAAHNIFVHRDSRPDTESLRLFSDMVPLPDLIVYVRSPLEILCDRTGKREDKSRRIKSGSERRFIENAEEAFEELFKVGRIRERAIALDNVSDDPSLIDVLACKVIERMREIKSDANHC
ncbi:MAG: hypothetical protein JW919_02045 [Candidatus Omnitrophica bacterium]|nr:hypothetical protein [Candidatus Omnitrophota bacterium]